VTETATPEPTATVTPGPSPTPTITPTIDATLTLTERSVTVATLREANVLLRDTIAQASEANLGSLRKAWQDKLFTVTKGFAAELYDRNARPFTIEFEYIVPPVVSAQTANDQVLITSQEKWRYDGPTKIHEEAFEFVYTLDRQDGRWWINSYTFRNIWLPPSTPAAPTARPVATATPTRAQN
jgi:hypothetical protein